MLIQTWFCNKPTPGIPDPQNRNIYQEAYFHLLGQKHPSTSLKFCGDYEFYPKTDADVCARSIKPDTLLWYFWIDDDSKIGVSDVLYQDYAGGVHLADFYIGANSVDLVDDDYTDTEYDGRPLTRRPWAHPALEPTRTSSPLGARYLLTRNVP